MLLRTKLHNVNMWDYTGSYTYYWRDKLAFLAKFYSTFNFVYNIYIPARNNPSRTCIDNNEGEDNIVDES